MEHLNEDKERIKSRLKPEYAINANVYIVIYVCEPSYKDFQGEFAESQEGLSKPCPLRSHCSQDSQVGGWTS
jgi:hypothetical protein